MNKVSSKLAAGVRKVKAEQKPASVSSKRAQAIGSNRAEKPAPKTGPTEHRTSLHPSRIWPD